MKKYTYNKFNSLLLPLLIVALFGFYPASILAMNHQAPVANMEGMTQMHHTTMPAPDTSPCITYHLNLLETLCQSNPVQSSALAIAMLAVFILGLHSISTLKTIRTFYTTLKTRYKRQRRIALQAFMAELGFWLSLIQTKFPAHAFSPA